MANSLDLPDQNVVALMAVIQVSTVQGGTHTSTGFFIPTAGILVFRLWPRSSFQAVYQSFLVRWI